MLPGINNIASFVRVQASGRASVSAPAVPAASAAAIDWDARGEARRELLLAVRALDRLEQSLDASRRAIAAPALARSSADIGVNNAPATAATLTSVEEVNATPTSFTPYDPLWNGASSAAVTLDGEYDGGDGSGRFTLEVQTGGLRGLDTLRIRMRDPQDQNLGTVQIKPGDPLDQVYAFNNGIQLTLGAGALVRRDVLEIDLFDNVGTSVDPSKPLGGVGAQDARLESAFSVVDGSFSINGETIAVSATDSLDDVLDRITNSAAGVNAVFDAASEQVRLSQKTVGAAYGITLGADSSGFLAAVKLDAATLTPGTDYEPDVPIAQVPALAGVSTGTLSVNGESIAIDVATDSLNDVIARINASAAGVHADLSGDAQRVSIASLDAGADIVLDDGATGFFAALNIAPQTYTPVAGGRGSSKSQSYRAADALEAVGDAFDTLFGGRLETRERSLRTVRAQVGRILADVLEENGASDLRRLGVNVALRESGEARLSIDEVSRRHFTRSLQRDVRPLQTLLNGPRDVPDAGLISRLRGVLEAGAASLGDGSGLGDLVSLFA